MCRDEPLSIQIKYKIARKTPSKEEIFQKEGNDSKGRFAVTDGGIDPDIQM